MNKKWITQDLKEVKEELDHIINRLSGNDYDITDFELDMQHAYSHLNLAYNTRNWTDEQINKFTQNDYENFRKTPKDLKFIDY